MLSYFIKKPKPSVSDYEFKLRHPFDKRKLESERLNNKCPNKCPIIVEKSDSSNVPDIKDHKWLVKRDLTFGQYMHILGSNIKLDNPGEILIYFVANRHLPSIASTIGDIYDKYKDKDGFLYITYSKKEFAGF